MKKAATSKDVLTECARQIAYQEGIGKLSIRRLASESGIAIGTVYNYFPSKADLIAEVLEDFWKQVFHGNGGFPGSMEQLASTPFPEAVEILFDCMQKNLRVFREEFLADLAQLDRVEKEKSRKTEKRYFQHMKQGLLMLLEQDPYVKEDIWTEHFTKEGLTEFVFSNMMEMLREEEADCRYLKEILVRLLYGREHAKKQEKGENQCRQ